VSTDSPRPVVLAIRNDLTDPPLLVGDWLNEVGIDIHVICADAGESVPSTVPDGIDGIIPMGGGMGANDDDVAPWLPNERALLRDAVTRGVPVFGICLGGQLLAAANGGVVELGETTEIGLSFIERTSEGEKDPLIQAIGAESRIPAAQWHQDHVSVLPSHATLLLTNDACRVQGYRIGANAYGFQLHPELDGDLFNWWVPLSDGDKALERAGIDVTVAGAEVAAASDDLVAAWRPMAHAWGRLVHEHFGSRHA
jgi:GMP synthase-like glutamine amidotransferase